MPDPHPKSETCIQPKDMNVNKEEWIKRYAERVQKMAGWNEDAARNAAEAGAEVFEDNERAAGNALAWENPEDEADEEMSCWSDDGDD